MELYLTAIRSHIFMIPKTVCGIKGFSQNSFGIGVLPHPYCTGGPPSQRQLAYTNSFVCLFGWETSFIHEFHALNASWSQFHLRANWWCPHRQHRGTRISWRYQPQHFQHFQENGISVSTSKWINTWCSVYQIPWALRWWWGYSITREQSHYYSWLLRTTVF